MRGIAIIAIILHNFTHWLRPMVKENEYTFNQHNADRLLVELMNPSIDLIAHLFSFFGHYGVPVFLFLSAYGLSKKYEGRPGGVGTGLQRGCTFVWRHYKKLFSMMILGYTAFVMVDYMTPGPRHYEFQNVIGQLLMVSNLYSEPQHAIWPGPYWYFGLTMQLYILYYLVIGRTKTWLTVVLTVACLATQISLGVDPMGDALNWFRYNIFGAMLPVAFGTIVARNEHLMHKQSRWQHLLILLLCVAIAIAGSFNYYAWTLIVPLAICVGTMAIVRALPQSLFRMFEWLGTLSSMMFVCHPITRKVLIPIAHRGDVYGALLLYLAATIVLAMIFKAVTALTPLARPTK